MKEGLTEWEEFQVQASRVFFVQLPSVQALSCERIAPQMPDSNMVGAIWVKSCVALEFTPPLAGTKEPQIIVRMH